MPPVTRGLLMANVGVQTVLTLGGSALVGRAAIEGGLVPARLTGAAALPGAVVPPALTLVTSQFVHGGWLHLAMNALFLIIVARAVEPLFGAGRFLTLYLVSGVAGGLLETLVHPGSLDPVVGASGAISGVFGAYVMRFAQRTGRDTSDLAAAARFAAAWIGLQLLVGLAGYNIAVVAHIGGFLAGLAIAARR